MYRPLLLGILALGALALGLWALAGSPPEPCADARYPDPLRSPYVLPYPVDAAYKVRQGNCDTTNTHHQGYRASFAYDFDMPLGSPVTAARGGQVILVEDSCADTDHDPDHGNRVIVRHEDASYALYGHLQQGSAQVQVGATVRLGQALARSGDSGLSRGPHLHLAVLRCDLVLGGLRLGCESAPVSFRNAGPTSGGRAGAPPLTLRGGEVYQALPW